MICRSLSSVPAIGLQRRARHGGRTRTFDEVLAGVIDLLQRQGRVSYWALKRQFNLRDDDLEDLKVEIVEMKGLAVDHDGKMLVWTGEAGTSAVPVRA